MCSNKIPKSNKNIVKVASFAQKCSKGKFDFYLAQVSIDKYEITSEQYFPWKFFKIDSVYLKFTSCIG
ncbi:hypothetical protein [Candidatus Uabimicrobium sp. HlEnr_7]|uniref:hypothetical protein n=1 Tax=Candidatus Uabimicrobium helgolandensis TaxID=3095367 RepID=UPI003556C9C4